MGIFKLGFDNSEDIGFVVACLFFSAIETCELRAWALLVANEEDKNCLPPYIFDLINFDQSPPSIYNIIGFAPIWNRTHNEEMALCGIAYKRGKNNLEDVVDYESAIKSLDENRHIFDRFKAAFPFIRMDSAAV